MSLILMDVCSLVLSSDDE